MAAQPELHLQIDSILGSARSVRNVLVAAGAEVGVARVSSDEAPDSEARVWRNKFLGSALFTVPMFVIAMILAHLPGTGSWFKQEVLDGIQLDALILWALSTPVEFWFGRGFFVGAYSALKNGYSNMDVLVALGTSAAYLYGCQDVIRAFGSGSGDSGSGKAADFFETAAMLISFILLGKYLECKAKQQACAAIELLMALVPPVATLCLPDGSEETLDVEFLQVGDTVKVVPGCLTAHTALRGCLHPVCIQGKNP